MATRRRRRVTAAVYFAIDIVVIYLFIIAGRDTRGFGFAGSLFEALPFFGGVVLGWMISKAWRHPRAVRWSGIIIWASTAVVGLTGRTLVGDPTDTRFVSITFVSIGVFLLGWRGIAWILDALFGRAIEKVVDEKYRR